MPLYRRMPKRGFLPYGGKTEFAIVNLKELAARFAAGSVVDPEALVAQAGSSSRSGRGAVKVLGDGDVAARAHGARARDQRGGPDEDRGGGRPRRGAARQGEGGARDRKPAELPEHLQDPGAQAPASS